MPRNFFIKMTDTDGQPLYLKPYKTGYAFMHNLFGAAIWQGRIANKNLEVIKQDFGCSNAHLVDAENEILLNKKKSLR